MHASKYVFILEEIPKHQSELRSFKSCWQLKDGKFFQPFLSIDAFFIFLLILEALTSLKWIFFLITAVEMYLWICIYSLYEKLKIEDSVKIAQYDMHNFNKGNQV
jgi:hypothetical protein